MAYELTYGENTLPKNITQQLINYSENELNVPPSYLITKLHYEGLWGGSDVARSNNNWGGMTWGGWSSPHTRESGVIVTRGSARPANEGGYYIRYASVNDFLIDWSHLIRRGGIYNVADSDTFAEAVKGMFIVGGAQYDYATMNVEGSQRRYELYLAGMQGRRSAINTANNGLLDTLDSESHSTGDAPDDTPGGVDVGDLDNIIEDGKVELINSVEVDFQPAIDYIMAEFTKLFNYHVFNISKDYEVNAFFNIIHTFKNQMKINPKPKLLSEMLKIIMEGLKRVKVNIDFDGVFDNIKDNIKDVFPNPDDDTTPDPDPDPDPDPTLTKVFPVKIQNGVNFFKRSNWGVGTLQRNMTYGVRSSGAWHYGYDIGGGVQRHNIYSVTNGKVIHASYMGGLGNYITIENDDDQYFLQYGHLHSFNVSVGDTVKAGDLIAVMGDTGGNYAIHLDIKISTSSSGFYAESTTIDPEKYLEVDGDYSTKLPQP